MSVEAMNWALHQQLPAGRAAAKHVLTIIANQASADPRHPSQMIAYPSIDYLVWATGQNRKTVMSNIKLLLEWRLIEDTGRRIGRTRQIPIYRVRCAPDLFHEQSRNRNSSNTGPVSALPAPESPAENSPEIGTVPKSEQSQILPETVPILGHGTNSITSCGGGARAPAEPELSIFDRQCIEPFLERLPAGIDLQVFANFVKHRAAMRRPLTVWSWLEIVPVLKALAADGVNLNESLRLTIRRSWTEPADPRRDAIPRRGGAPPRPRANDDLTHARYDHETAHDDLPAELRVARTGTGTDG